MKPTTHYYCFSPIKASLNIFCNDALTPSVDNFLHLEILDIIQKQINDTELNQALTNQNKSSTSEPEIKHNSLEYKPNAVSDEYSFNYIFSKIISKEYLTVDFEFALKSVVSTKNQIQLWKDFGDNTEYVPFLTTDDFEKLFNTNIYNVEEGLQEKVFNDMITISKIGNKTKACSNTIFNIIDDVLLSEDLHFSRTYQTKSSSFFDFDMNRANFAAWHPKQFSRSMEQWLNSSNDNFIQFHGSMSNSIKTRYNSNPKLFNIQSSDLALFKTLKLLNLLDNRLPNWCDNEISITISFKPKNSLNPDSPQNFEFTTKFKLSLFLNEINAVINKKSKNTLKNASIFLAPFLQNKKNKSVKHKTNSNNAPSKNKSATNTECPNNANNNKIISATKIEPDLDNGLVIAISKDDHNLSNINYLWINPTITNHFCNNSQINWRYLSKIIPGLDCFWQFNSEIHNNGFSLYSNSLKNEVLQDIPFPKLSYKLYKKDTTRIQLPTWLTTLMDKIDGPFSFQKAKVFFLQKQKSLEIALASDSKKNTTNLNEPNEQNKLNLTSEHYEPIEAKISFESHNYSNERSAELNALNALYEKSQLSNLFNSNSSTATSGNNKADNEKILPNKQLPVDKKKFRL